jgi:hypothetical protein
VNEDFHDFLQHLNAAHVRYLVVGAHALGVHGTPRATGDLDLWVDRTAENADRIMVALTTFGAPVESLGIRRDDFTVPDVVAQLGLPPARIDLLTTISGVEFDTAWAGRIEAVVEGVRVFAIGKAELIQNKLATGRPKDRVDVESLRDPGS